MSKVNVRPEQVVVSFDNEMIVMSSAYPRRDRQTGIDMLTTALAAAMEFAASVDAEFAIVDPDELREGLEGDK